MKTNKKKNQKLQFTYILIVFITLTDHRVFKRKAKNWKWAMKEILFDRVVICTLN